MSNKHHTESSHTHDQKRKAHDRQQREYEHNTDMSNPWHESKNVRIGVAVVAIIAVVSITLLFISGVIRW